MPKKISMAVLCSFAFFGQTHAQEVIIPREAKPNAPERVASISEQAGAEIGRSQSVLAAPVKSQVREKQPGSAKLTVEQMRRAGVLAGERGEKLPRLEPANMAHPSSHPPKPETTGVRPLDRPAREEEPIRAHPLSFSGETAFIRLANGFDFPVGKPEAQGYYKARGFRSGGHLGEDWDGIGGGDTDLGDPIYSIGDGVVVFARDCHMGWGNVVIVRHAYKEGGAIKNIDSLYGHLDSILVQRGQRVVRGEKIATMGTAHGLYDAHLHLEIRKNITIGMSRDAFAHDFSNYYDPSQFILSHRNLQTGARTYRVAMNTFTHDTAIRWDKARNYSHHRGGTAESAAALKKALASQH
jgi:murein DD-endopeptidase MepM/ murein hydrolase activator NlpD